MKKLIIMKEIILPSLAMIFQQNFSGKANNPITCDMVTSAAARGDTEFLKFLFNDIIPIIYRGEIVEVISNHAIRKADGHNHNECALLIHNFLVDNNIQVEALDLPAGQEAIEGASDGEKFTLISKLLLLQPQFLQGDATNPLVRDMVTSAAARDHKEFLNFLFNSLIEYMKYEIVEVINMDAIKKAAKHGNLECLSSILDFLDKNEIIELKGERIIDSLWTYYLDNNLETKDTYALWHKAKDLYGRINEVNDKLVRNENLELKFFAEVCCSMIQSRNAPDRTIIPDDKKDIFDYILASDEKYQPDFIENLCKKFEPQDSIQEDQAEIPVAAILYGEGLVVSADAGASAEADTNTTELAGTTLFEGGDIAAG